jgi:predicted nucleic acid-binding protein
VIVVDASAAIAGLLNAGPARHALATEQLHAPHLVDAEVASGLRRRVMAKQLDAESGWTALDTWRRLGLTRHPIFGLLDRVWELRENVSAYDASYIALAERLGCSLLTADARLGGAPRLRCPITVIPR